jgi:hypothetical protein
MSELLEIFERLPLPAQTGAAERIFSVQPLNSRSGQFVARTAEGNACLLLETPFDVRQRAPIVLQNLRVTFSVPCELNVDSALCTAQCMVVECLSAESHIRRYFFLVAARILGSARIERGSEHLIQAIDTLTALFQRLTRPSVKDAQGIFGELFAVDLANCPEPLMEAWRVDPHDIYDFSLMNLRFEVKTNAGRQRSHQFSVDQCSPPEGIDGVLLSLLLERSNTGLSLEALIQRLEVRLAARPDLVTRLYEGVAATLGATLPQALDQRFDEHLARASAAFYDLREVPAIRGPLPAGVSAVRFTSDLGALRAMDMRGALRRFPNLSDAFPSRPL